MRARQRTLGLVALLLGAFMLLALPAARPMVLGAVAETSEEGRGEPAEERELAGEELAARDAPRARSPAPAVAARRRGRPARSAPRRLAALGCAVHPSIRLLR